MTKSSIQVANHSDEHSVISTLVMAFSADPAVRWAYPDPHQYLAHFPNFAKSFGGKAFAHGSAHVIAGRAGAALWLPPGVEPDEEELGTLVAASAHT